MKNSEDIERLMKIYESLSKMNNVLFEIVFYCYIKVQNNDKNISIIKSFNYDTKATTYSLTVKE